MLTSVSLRWKLVVASLLPSAAIFAGGMWLASAYARQVVESELGARLVAVAQVAATTLPVDRLLLLQVGDEGTRTYQHLQARLQEMKRATQAARMYVVDVHQNLLCDAEGQGRVGDPVPAMERDRLELTDVFQGHARPSSVLFRGDDGRYYKSGYAPLLDEQGHVVGAVAVDGSAAFFAPLQDLRRRMWLLSLLGATLMAVLLFAVGSALVAPIYRLVRWSEAIAAGALDTSVDLGPRGDELGFLASRLDEMRRALAARDRQLQMMLSGVAHEVRNPLGGMELYAGMLAEDLHDRPAQLDQLSKIRRELDYLKVLVDEFLDFARVRPLQTEKVRPEDLLSEISELSGPLLETKGLTLALSTQGEIPEVALDPAAIRRVLLNLLRNAVEASPKGATIRLELSARGDGFRLTVNDEGPGVPEAKRDQIFEPFFTTKEKGTGLGLAMARKMVVLHGGSLRLLELSPGAHFELILPGTPPAQPPLHALPVA
jgi:signal transduction histidine kinase